MKYRVKLTDEFLEEIEEICEYISNELKKLKKQIKSKDNIEEL